MKFNYLTTDGIKKPLTVNKDDLFDFGSLCDALDIKQIKKAFNKIKPKHKSVINDKPFVTEEGMYKTLLQCDSYEAEPFQDWVCEDVLPKLRKEMAKPVTQLEIAESYVIALRDNAAKDVEIETLTPKARYADQIMNQGESLEISEWAKVLSEEQCINIQPNKHAFTWLRSEGYTMRGRNGSNERNKPFEKYIQMGWFEHSYNEKASKHSGRVIYTTYITGTGQVELGTYLTNWVKSL